jgi:hypothetical protein
MPEQLLLLDPDITVLRPVEIEGSRYRWGLWKVRYWNCACGKTLHHNQVIQHLCTYHFYSERDAKFTFRQAKLGKPQHLPTLVNQLGGRNHGAMQSLPQRD